MGVREDMHVHTHILHYNWWKSPNQANIFQRHPYLEVGSKMPAEFQFGVKICALMCYSTLSPPWLDEYCAAHHQTHREKPPRGQWREGREGGAKWGKYQGEKLCRSMKNCSGILPPQLAVWEADLISGESIWLELWEITLLNITLVTAVETCSDGGSVQRLWYFILAIYAFKDISMPVTVLRLARQLVW